MTLAHWLNGFVWGLCSHKNQTVPITLDGLTARTCLDCGLRMPWSFLGPELPPPRLTQLGANQYDVMFLRDLKMEGKP